MTMTMRGETTAARCLRLAVLGMFLAAVAACGDGNYAPQKPVGPKPGPKKQYDSNYDSLLFGKEGVGLNSLHSNRPGGILGGKNTGSGGAMPVNKYIWQAALDTLSFLPLASTDPYTGVIATDWGATPDAPGERFKVTAYVLSAALSGASLKVAVYREVMKDKLWVPAPVDPQTAVKLENAILTRAREMRIAENTKTGG